MWTARLAAKWRSDKILYSIQALLREERWYYFTIAIAQFIHVFPRIFLLGLFNATWGGCPLPHSAVCLVRLPAPWHDCWMHSVLRWCNLFQFPYALCSSNSPWFTWPGALTFQQKTAPPSDMFSDLGKKSNVHPISVSLGPDRIVCPGSSVLSTPRTAPSPDISPLGLQHARDSNSCARTDWKMITYNDAHMNGYCQYCVPVMTVFVYPYVHHHVYSTCLHYFKNWNVDTCVNMCIRKSTRQYVGVSICWYTHI